jgi:hypothetical protein
LAQGGWADLTLERIQSLNQRTVYREQPARRYEDPDHMGVFVESDKGSFGETQCLGRGHLEGARIRQARRRGTQRMDTVALLRMIVELLEGSRAGQSSRSCQRVNDVASCCEPLTAIAQPKEGEGA